MITARQLIYLSLLLVFPVCFLLHNVNENFELLLIYLLITLAISSRSIFVLGQINKAFYFSFILLIYIKRTNRSFEKPAIMIGVFLMLNLLVEAGGTLYNMVTQKKIKKDFEDRNQLV